jgi:hypothetical protein
MSTSTGHLIESAEGVSLAGAPRAPNAGANTSSAKTSPSSSRTRIARLPLGNAARATRTVSSGTRPSRRGRIDTRTPPHRGPRDTRTTARKIITQREPTR